MSRPLVIALLALGVGCGRFGFGVAGDDVITGDAKHDDSGGGDGGGSDGGTDGTSVDSPPSASVYTVDVPMTFPVVTIPIPAVDPSRTWLTCDVRTNSSSVDHLAACELVDATTVRISMGATDASTTVHLQLIRLPAGSVVQRGLNDVGSNAAAAALLISPVDLARSFAYITRYANLDSAGLDARFALLAELTDTTTLSLTRLATGNTVYVAWQVIQLPPGASVASGRTTLGNALTTTQTAIPSHEQGRSFTLATSQTGSSNEADNAIRVELPSATAVSFRRIGTDGDVIVAWFVVTLPEILVLHGTISPGTSPTVQFPLFGVLDPDNSAAVMSTSGGRLANNDDLKHLLVTTSIDASNITFYRAANPLVDVNATIGLSAIQWPP